MYRLHSTHTLCVHKYIRICISETHIDNRSGWTFLRFASRWWISPLTSSVGEWTLCTTTSVLLLMATQIYEQCNRLSYKKYTLLHVRIYMLCVCMYIQYIECVYTYWMDGWSIVRICVYRVSVLSDAALPLSVSLSLFLPLSICFHSSHCGQCLMLLFLLIVSFYPGFVTIEESIQLCVCIYIYIIFCIRIRVYVCIFLIWFFFSLFAGQFSSGKQINHGLCYGFWIHDRFVSNAKSKNKKLSEKLRKIQ